MIFGSRISFSLLLIINVYTSNFASSKTFLNITDTDFPEVECGTPFISNGVIKLNFLNHSAKVICRKGFDRDGPESIDCVKNQWSFKPRCVPRCFPPPNLENGVLHINEKEDENGNYRTGTLASYSCEDGFKLTPDGSEFRVCEGGNWTGPVVKCVKTYHNLVTICDQPSDIVNGYFALERNDLQNSFGIGQRLHYSCKKGYILEGSPVLICTEGGTWSPKIQPICWKHEVEQTQDVPCGEFPFVPHSTVYVVQGKKIDDTALPGTVIEIKCQPIFRDFEKRLLESCQPTRLTCSGGRWIGIPPICVPSMECPPPPVVAHATMSIISGFKTAAGYPIKSQVTYQCLPEYILEGNEVLACSEGGCWFPSEPPTCLRIGTNYYLEVNNNLNAFLVSMATGAGVLSLLLVICLLVIFRRKRQLARALAIPPPVPRQDIGDHAILLHQPDRLALIAFADSIQGQRNLLPSYDEATRDRAPAAISSSVRLQRPHWQHISGRRARNSPNPELVHIGRHGSFVSHTPSTRSAGDSMGSTDTMAISENSTNVTLDTASSHSGSQAPSCRAHCGSLASFDTGSVIITEDVPLLEESELEELQVCDTISLVLENPSLSDNASHKLSTASVEIS